jgi:hypothetical protein
VITNTGFARQVDQPFKLSLLKKTFQDQVKHSEEKDHDRYLINTMHHFDVDISRTIGVLFPEEVSSNFAQAEELLPPSLLFCLFYVM